MLSTQLPFKQILALLWAALAVTSAWGVTVESADELEQAIRDANGAGGNTTILVADGTYTLADTLYVNAPGIEIVGASGSRDRVIIQGDAMSPNAAVGNIIRVAASDFSLRHVTLRRSRWHLIQIVGEADADRATIQDVVFQDAYQQMLKVTVDPAFPEVSADDGLVEDSLFEYTGGIGPQWYIGGIDAHAAKRWIVRGNHFRNISSPDTRVSEFAIHFWGGSADLLIERNLIVNSDRGVGLGLDGGGNTGGIVRNNMIYHDGNSGPFADVGISINHSPGTQIYNNTVVLQSDFPWGIEFRFSTTTAALIANNLSNRPIQQRDGAQAILSSNRTNAQLDWFTNTFPGDLHLSRPVEGVVDSGTTVPGLDDDFDKDLRSSGNLPDIGADELTSRNSTPKPPILLDN